jgi:MFS family permease
VADLSPAHLRGASFGPRQGLDTVGAFAGPVVAIVAMGLLANGIRAVFWIAIIPALGGHQDAEHRLLGGRDRGRRP